MKEYTKTDPVFSSKIVLPEVTDPGHADIINNAPMQLLQNTLCNQREIKQLKKNMGAGDTNEYSTEVKYHTGEYCLYNNMLYRCLKDTQGEWNAECWVQTNPMVEIMNLRNSLDSLMGVFEKNEEGNLRHLGAAAFASLANNLTTTNEGFAMDARVGPIIDKRCTDLETSVSNLNSALGFTYASVNGTSFTDAFNNAQQNVSANRNMAASLDTMHASIGNYANGMYTIAGANQFYCVFLCKQNNSAYCGIIMSYYMYPPMFFAVNGTTFRLMVARQL